MIVFFSQILYDPFSEDLFHNVDCTIVGKQNPTAKSKIKRKISLYNGTNSKVFQSVNAMYSKIIQRIPYY